MPIRRQRGRAVPLPTPTTEEAARLAALLTGDAATVRAHAAAWGIPLVDCDDTALLESIHRARVAHPGVPADAKDESRRWLKERDR